MKNAQISICRATLVLVAALALATGPGCGSSNTPIAGQTSKSAARPAESAPKATTSEAEPAPSADAPAAAPPAEHAQAAPAEHAEQAEASPPATATQLAAAASQGDAYGQAEKKKFDPVEINGKFFEGWSKPKLAVIFSGRQDGYLEPCGCAGLENQKGGVSRRHSLIRQLEAQGWPLASVDVGGLVRRFGKQAEVKFGIAAESLKQMGYSAVGFGPSDLRLSAGEIVAAVAAAKPEDSIFVSANVNLFDLTPKVRIVEAGGMKLGITSVLGDEYQQQVNNAEIEMQPAAAALGKVVDQLKDCDVRILLAHATVEETKKLAEQFPQFSIVVTSDGRDIPPMQPEELGGGAQRLLEIAPKAMYVIVAGFYDDPQQPVRFQRVALDSRFSDSSEMKQLMATYQDQLQQLGWEGLGLRSVPHPRTEKGAKLSGQFASAESCKECHPTAFGIWSKSKHAHATESLTKLDPPRQYDPECISCHSTGWNPQEYFPYISGFESLEKTPLLAGNSCENCHGPAAAHVEAERKRTSKREAEREALKLTAGFARDNVCIKCHDHDNSPEFNPESFDTKYWPKVEHKGKK